MPSGLYDEEKLSINRGSIYISEHSPPQVSEAYSDQFRQDFLFFLHSRSEELVRDGKMILILLGREGPGHVDRGNSFFWELLTRAFAKLVDQVSSSIYHKPNQFKFISLSWIDQSIIS